MGSLQLVLCVFLGWFFFGFHRSLRGNGGAFCAEYLVIHVVNVNFTHSLTEHQSRSAPSLMESSRFSTKAARSTGAELWVTNLFQKPHTI